MIVNCPGCGKMVPSADMNLDNMMAKCPSCNELIDLRTSLSSNTQIATDKSKSNSLASPKEDLPVPVGWDVKQRLGEHVMTWRWFSIESIFMLLFCIFWDSFLIFWYAQAITSGHLVMLLFPIGHVAVGVGFTYATLANLFNRTTITIRGRDLAIQHGPIPWRGNRTVRLSEIKEAFYEQRNVLLAPRRRNVPRYQVNIASSNSDRSFKLLTVDTSTEANYLTTAIKDAAGLK